MSESTFDRADKLLEDMKKFQGDLQSYTKKIEGRNEEMRNKLKELIADGDKDKQAAMILQESDKKAALEKQYSEHQRKHIERLEKQAQALKEQLGLEDS